MLGVEWLLHNLFQSFARLEIPWPHLNAQSVLDIKIELLDQRDYCRTNDSNYRRNYGGLFEKLDHFASILRLP